MYLFIICVTILIGLKEFWYPILEKNRTYCYSKVKLEIEPIKW
jgi:hypothetical protein